MAARLPKPHTAFARTPRRQPREAKAAAYLDWIRTLPCVISGATPVEAAHVSTAAIFYGHPGRGKGNKAADRWALPLSPRLHREQHGMAEGAFWKKYGVDPHLLALVLFALWDQGVSDRYVVEDVLAMHRPAKERAENAVLATTLGGLRNALDKDQGRRPSDSLPRWPLDEIATARNNIASVAALVASLEADNARLREAGKAALGHIEHMAAFIGSKQLGYSFEALGEDIGDIRAALGGDNG